MALSQTFYVAAIPSAGVSISTLIAICAVPVIIALISALMTRERLTPLALFALVGAVGGTVLLVAARPHLNEGSVSFLGVFLAFLSACAYAGFILCRRLLTGSYHPLQINFVAFDRSAASALLYFINQINAGLSSLGMATIALSGMCSKCSWVRPLSDGHAFTVRDRGKYRDDV